MGGRIHQESIALESYSATGHGDECDNATELSGYATRSGQQ